MAIIHPVGELQDECEKKVVQYLAKNLPDYFHVYHNLELIQYRKGHPYEYDLIVVGRSSVWAIEVKGYKGVIKGNAANWRFPNGRTEKSPIPLINLKARVLKSNLERFAPRLRDLPFYVDSLVVFCFNGTKVQISDPQSDRVCRLFELPSRILQRESGGDKARKTDQIQETVCRMLDERFGPITPIKTLGEYEIEDSMADLNVATKSATYPARHRLLASRGRVMLKVFHLDTRLSEVEIEKQKKQIIREAEALSLLGAHPNIVRCYAPFLWEDDMVAIPFEWVDGVTLREALESKRDWALLDRLELFRMVCTGLVHAHQNGIIHRGLSPENILRLEDGRIKLGGFKLAKILSSSSSSKSMTRYLIGEKPNYLAPELFLDIHAAKPASDIYSLGVLLYELVTGECPSITESGLSERQINRLYAACGKSHSALIQIVERMCEFAPRLRYNSVNKVMEDLQSLR